MKKLNKIKRIVRIGLQWVALGTVLLGGAAYAADAVKAAPAAASSTAKDLILKGDATCTGCHDEADDTGVDSKSMLALHPSVLAIGKTKHGVQADGRTPTCTNCHGDSLKHVNKPEGVKERPRPDRTYGKKSMTPVAERNDACLTCHKKDAKRSHWEGSIHQSRDVACTSCHQVHTAHDKVRDKLTQPEVCFTCHKEQRTQINKPSHHPIVEGKMTCSDCHNPHGSVGPKLMKRDSVVDTCYTCHMEKRGPFVHNHEPVSEDCSTCHNPHGTVTESMLKTRPPFLCHQCHTPHGPFIPQIKGQQAPGNIASNATGKGASNFTQGRGCLNCHTQVHGSNNPALTSPTPQFNFR
ncbi:MAG: DmsE family decaheme c-type cytochrome [Pseudomonadota bacterium]